MHDLGKLLQHCSQAAHPTREITQHLCARPAFLNHCVHIILPLGKLCCGKMTYITFKHHHLSNSDKKIL